MLGSPGFCFAPACNKPLQHKFAKEQRKRDREEGWREEGEDRNRAGATDMLAIA